MGEEHRAPSRARSRGRNPPRRRRRPTSSGRRATAGPRRCPAAASRWSKIAVTTSRAGGSRSMARLAPSAGEPIAGSRNQAPPSGAITAAASESSQTNHEEQASPSRDRWQAIRQPHRPSLLALSAAGTHPATAREARRRPRKRPRPRRAPANPSRSGTSPVRAVSRAPARRFRPCRAAAGQPPPHRPGPGEWGSDFRRPG